MLKAPACTFVIFGISGDLAARKLLPALFELHRDGAIDPETRIVGFARRDWSDDELRERMKTAVTDYGYGDVDQAL
jgi:glucose-6-phosphate 1-dehydrogenase